MARDTRKPPTRLTGVPAKPSPGWPQPSWSKAGGRSPEGRGGPARPKSSWRAQAAYGQTQRQGEGVTHQEKGWSITCQNHRGLGRTADPRLIRVENTAAKRGRAMIKRLGTRSNVHKGKNAFLPALPVRWFVPQTPLRSTRQATAASLFHSAVPVKL